MSRRPRSRFTRPPRMSGDVGVHFSSSRTSRPVGCRLTARGAARRRAARRATNPRNPGRLPDGTHTVSGRQIRTGVGPAARESGMKAGGKSDLAPSPDLSLC